MPLLRGTPFLICERDGISLAPLLLSLPPHFGTIGGEIEFLSAPNFLFFPFFS